MCSYSDVHNVLNVFILRNIICRGDAPFPSLNETERSPGWQSDIHRRRWRQDSTSPVNTKAVTLTIFLFPIPNQSVWKHTMHQWFCWHLVGGFSINGQSCLNCRLDPINKLQYKNIQAADGNFHIICIEWEVYFDSNVTAICSQGSNSQYRFR